MTFKIEDFTPGVEILYETGVGHVITSHHWVVREMPDYYRKNFSSSDYVYVESKLDPENNKGMFDLSSLNTYRSSFKNLKIVPVEIPYDPTQQADQDDDI